MRKALLATAWLVAFAAAGGAVLAQQKARSVDGDVVVRADFARRTDPPLVKKFAQYNAGLPPLENYERDLKLVDELFAESLRLDLGMGKGRGRKGAFAADVVTGSLDDLRYDFRKLDALAEMLNVRDVRPYYAWCYVPRPFQRVAGDWRTMRKGPEAMAAWQRMHRDLARHFKDRGIRIGYHEIYNEPDLQAWFLLEPFEHYLEMYKHGARGIREGDPDAVVGGPALAHAQKDGHARQFVQWVKKEDLPLDFFSFHVYWQEYPFRKELQFVRDALASDPRFRNTQIHVNELAWPTGWQGAQSPNNFYAMAAHLLGMFEEILEATDVTLTSHAQFMESTYREDAYGIVHRNGRRKAAFHAYKIYADMPVERNPLSLSGRSLGGMASSDPHKAAVVLWSNSDRDQTVRAELAGVSFANGTLTVYRVDKDHASFFDGAGEDLQAVECRPDIATAKLSWSGVLPARGVVYLTVRDVPGEDFQPAARARRVADVVRVDHYYEKRGASNYAEFDRRAWTAYLGMGKETSARSLLGVTAEKWPDVVRMTIRLSGPEGKTRDGLPLGIRLDYQGTRGFANSVLFHAGPAGAGRPAAFPWGTRRAPDRPVSIGGKASFDIRLADYAPDGWTGRAVLSIEMRDAGRGARATVEFVTPSERGPPAAKTRVCTNHGSLSAGTRATVQAARPIAVEGVEGDARGQPDAEPDPGRPGQSQHQPQAGQDAQERHPGEPRRRESPRPPGLAAAEHQHAGADDQEGRQRADVAQVVGVGAAGDGGQDPHLA